MRGTQKKVYIHQGKDRPGTAISHLYIVSRQLRLTRVYCVQIRNWSSVYQQYGMCTAEREQIHNYIRDHLYRIPIINESLQLAYSVNPAYVCTLIHTDCCSCSIFSLIYTNTKHIKYIHMVIVGKCITYCIYIHINSHACLKYISDKICKDRVLKQVSL